MARTMYDSVDVTQIPPTATMAAVYRDGKWRTEQAARQRLPKARLVTITVFGTTSSDVVDIENGDCTPASGVAAVKRGTAHTPYSNLAELAAVLHQIDAQGLPRSTPIWTAHYTGQAHLCGAACFAGLNLPWTPLVVATQYTDKALGRNLDASVVAAYWPGVDPSPIRPHFLYPGLRPGATGKWVALAQHLLNVHDPALHLVVDGQYGPATRAAVDRFKRRRGWPADGIIGWRVWKALTG